MPLLNKARDFAVTAGVTIALFASAALADECPPGQVGVNVTPPGPSESSNQTDSVIASLDLDTYQIPDRKLRLRRLEVQPGGIVRWHSHEDRPDINYILSGEITEYRSTCRMPILHRAGDVTVSDKISHWWRNNSRSTAILLSADVLPPQTTQAR